MVKREKQIDTRLRETVEENRSTPVEPGEVLKGLAKDEDGDVRKVEVLKKLAKDEDGDVRKVEVVKIRKN